jgi:glycosyltransferase involved in cell wall biosynthesis
LNVSSCDVVVPCYNYAQYLEACVSSVLHQQGVDVRVLIIDDASSDRSAEVGMALAARDPRVTFRRHETNLGHIKTFNEGIIGWASAKYTLLISADDALAPGALKRAAKVMDEHPDVGMTYGLAQVIIGDDPPLGLEDAENFEYQIISGRGYLRRNCEYGNGISSPTAVVRTALQHKVGGYNQRMVHTSDMEMWMRIAVESSIGAINAVQAYYRWHGANMMLGYVRGVLGDRRHRFLTCKEVSDRCGNRVEGINAWVEAMRRGYVGEACWTAALAMECGDRESETACLQFAKDLDPALWHSPSWWRYVARRCMGPRLSRGLRMAVGRSAGVSDLAFAGQQVSVSYQHGQRIGWWPGDAHTGSEAG